MPFCFCPDLMGAKGDLNKFLDKVAAAGGPGKVGLRIFTQYLWGRGRDFMAYNQAKTKAGELIWYTHETTHIKQRVFDQSGKAGCWNPGWFIRFDMINTLCWQKRIYLCPSLHDYRNPDKYEKYFYPFRCSLQGLGADNVKLVTPKEAQTLFSNNTDGIYGAKLKPTHVVWAKKIISSLTANYFLEAANEFSQLTWALTSKVPLEWHRWWAAAIQGLVPDNRKTRIITSGLTDDILKRMYHFSYHGIGNLTAYNKVKSKIVSKNGIISGDGFFAGAGRADAKGRRGASVGEMTALAKQVKADGHYGLEVMDRGLWAKDNDNADLDAFDPSTLKAAADILNA